MLGSLRRALPFTNNYYHISTKRYKSLCAIYNQHGNPLEVLKLVEDTKVTTQELKSNEVQIKFLACPINPADLNMIRGGYGIEPVFPAIGGNEGVAIVTKIGKSVSTLKEGDRVLPNTISFGTWRNLAITSETNLIKVSEKIPIEYAAVMFVNPCTAYRLLHDFVDLQEGDVIVQNGANSVVGQAVIQLAALKGIKTINFIRQSEYYEQNVEHLKGLGGYIVCPIEYVRNHRYKRLISDIPIPKLGLNCIGGVYGTEVIRSLGKNGVFVTYGGMSREPVVIPTSRFIFKNILAKGFWLTEWIKNHTVEEKKQMLEAISKLIEDKKLHMWVTKHKFSEIHEAIGVIEQHRTRRKTVLMMEE